jgi:hypothetical protein
MEDGIESKSYPIFLYKKGIKGLFCNDLGKIMLDLCRKNNTLRLLVNDGVTRSLMSST